MASPGKNKAESIALNEAIQAVQSSAELIGSLMGDIKENAVILATLRAELQVLKEEVNNISNILTDGTAGARPIQTRVGMLEGQLETLLESLEKIKIEFAMLIEKAILNREKAAEKQITSCSSRFGELDQKLSTLQKCQDALQLERDIKLERIKGKWQLYVALGTGTLAFLGVVLTLLDKYLG